MADTDQGPVVPGPEPARAPADPPAGAAAPPPDDAETAAIDAAERAAIEQRRREAGIAAAEGATLSSVGLALSGGGVRSATFCLGLIRGLAQNGLLPRFDYLSTVSGGGYAGAALGRLIAALGIADAQRLLSRGDTLLLAWLRRYGRYLAPRGARDYGIAIATYLRAGLAVHLEFALLAIAIGTLVVLPHLLQSLTSLLAPQDWSGWRTAWWPLAALSWLLLAPGNLMAYWALRDVAPKDAAALNAPPRYSRWDIAMILVAGAVTVLLASRLSDAGPPLPAYSAKFLAVLVLASVSGYGLWLWTRVRGASDDRDTFNTRERDLLTAHLRKINLIALVLAALGAVDLLSWKLLQNLEAGAPWVYGSLGLGSLLVVVVRAFGEPIQRLLSTEEGPRPGLMPLLINVLGLGAALVLLVLWVTVVQWWVFGRHGTDPHLILSGLCERLALPAWDLSGLLPRWRWLQWMLQQPTLLRLLWLLLGLLIWFLGTGMHTETVNATSLHGFYRSRLTRTYLAVGNLIRFPGQAVLGAREVSPEEFSNVVATVRADDVALTDYRPHERGGPVHLINVCLNQTRGASSKLYNADRKGAPLVASTFGLEVGRDGERAAVEPQRLDKLGRWIAISGAAASPGAGSNTTAGWAMLLFLVGARLGYWFDTGRTAAQLERPMAGVGPVGTTATQALGLALWRRYRNSKFGRLIAEATASFDGESARAWYLSDGGHFDNTGLHSLLRRQLDFIVLADCGADPAYEFADLENLIRKARIDFGAEIEFYTEDSACHLPLMQDEHICVLPPEKLRDNYTARGVMLARIRYRPDAQGRCKQGTLLVVKPNLHFALDSDVLAYARRNPQFPQQPTSDQFFDEAQWESYHRLGEDFGRALRPGWLEQLPGWSVPVAPQDALPSLRRLRPIAARADEAGKPFWRPETKAAALSAGLGAGLIATLALPAWQVYDKLAAQREQDRLETRKRLDELRAKLPVWARKGEAAPAGAEAVDIDEDAQALLDGLYQQVRRERGTLSDGGRVVARVQASCGLPVSKALAQACPPVQSAHRKLCEAVCDPPTRDPYWERSDQAAALAIAPVAESVESSADASAVLSTDAGVYGQEDPDAVLPQDIALPERQIQKKQMAPLAATSESPGQRVQRLCHRQVVYVQVYDEATRARAAALPWKTLQPGATMPGIENVVRSARARNADAPKAYAQPTLVVHRIDDDGACAEALKDWLTPQLSAWYGPAPQVELRKLPGAFKPEDRVIELWLPNARAPVQQAASPGLAPASRTPATGAEPAAVVARVPATVASAPTR
ncbi:hypothetical protein [Lysobacter sp. cf310]|uniref:hypothetical protein n=1 Tax=Lysobacter sp. cf310 TaxID=1761790 RepID=UPI0008EBD71E|nr:hypothetical protein [Lysobacter sp. cf310]SFK37142.1 Patatin-like phospholipase [Lysobacter sp. cf310]